MDNKCLLKFVQHLVKFADILMCLIGRHIHCYLWYLNKRDVRSSVGKGTANLTNLQLLNIVYTYNKKKTEQTKQHKRRNKQDATEEKKRRPED